MGWVGVRFWSLAREASNYPGGREGDRQARLDAPDEFEFSQDRSLGLRAQIALVVVGFFWGGMQIAEALARL